MIVAALLLAAAAPQWIPVGVSQSRLRVFVDRSSLRIAQEMRAARIRIGAPGAISGKVVLVYQDERIDCARQTWRMIAYEALDDGGRTIAHSAPGARDFPTLAVAPGTIGDAVVRTVCAF